MNLKINESKPKIFSDMGFTFELNNSNNTALLIGEIIDANSRIPKTLTYENKTYNVKVKESSFFLKKMKLKEIQIEFFSCIALRSITFPESSNLETLNAVFHPSIESINFPSSLKYVNGHIFFKCPKLTQIHISPKNKYFGYIDENKKLIGVKSNQDTYKTLLFACRDIKKAKIPPDIVEIGPNSFKDCKCLYSIEFENDSKLAIINENAFSNCPFKDFIFPPKLKNIDMHAFTGCKYLKAIEFEENCRISKINEYAFNLMDIRNILLPQSCYGISSNNFVYCHSLLSIELLSDDVYFGCKIFNSSVSMVSCPNAKQIYFSDKIADSLNENLRIYLSSNAKII